MGLKDSIVAFIDAKREQGKDKYAHKMQAKKEGLDELRKRAALVEEDAQILNEETELKDKIRRAKSDAFKSSTAGKTLKHIGEVKLFDDNDSLFK